jgi:hypothetical protein
METFEKAARNYLIKYPETKREEMREFLTSIFKIPWDGKFEIRDWLTDEEALWILQVLWLFRANSYDEYYEVLSKDIEKVLETLYPA